LTLAPTTARAQGAPPAATTSTAETPPAETPPAETPPVAETPAVPETPPVPETTTTTTTAALPAAPPAAVEPLPPPVVVARAPTGGPQLEGPRDGVPDCRATAAACFQNDLFALWPRLRLRAGYELVQADSQILTVGQNDGFFLDQTRFGVDGAFKDDLRFRLILDVVTLVPGGAPNDPVQTVNAAVRDAWVAWIPSDWFFISAGQQFMPADLEGSTTIAGLPFARRSVASAGVRPGHGFAVAGLSPSRQVGVVLGSTENAKLGPLGVEYLFGVGNGNGQNISGNDNKLPAGYVRVGVAYELSSSDVARIGGGIRHNPRTVGTLPNLFTETDNLGFVDASVKLMGLNVAGQFIYKSTAFGTLFPDAGEGSSDTGLGASAWIFADKPFGIELGGVIPAYRFSYYDPSSTFADDQLLENTFGVRWDVPVKDLPLSLFVDATVLTEFGDNVRDLDNARVTALLQLEL
jgi:hypothetical protein